MPEAPTHNTRGLITRGRQPLIGLPLGEGTDEAVQFFTSEAEADEAVARDPRSHQRALSAIGAWSDLNFDEMLDALDRIRHESKPTPPIDLDP